MRKRVTILMAMTAVLSGCQGRSISNSGYPADASHVAANSNLGYRGEIDDFDLLVPAESEAINDQDIDRVLASHHDVRAEIGKPLLVVQSGAIAPDGEMITELQRHFPVIPFNGQPPLQESASTANTMAARSSQPSISYARRLRLAAAEGGADHILVYWGILETARRDEAASLVSWVPVIGQVIPDQSQEMRIRLKAALIETASGQWRMMTPPPVADDSLSSSITRRQSDQDQVALLKRQGYLALADQLTATAGD